MSWGRIDYDGKAGWPATLAALQTAGVELPLGLAVVDLRWWQDRILAPGSTEELPSLPELAERWGWRSDTGKPSVKRVRLLLQRDAEWSDPYRLEAWRALRGEGEGHGEGTARAREGHDKGTTDHADTPTIDDGGHGKGTARAREGHDEGNTRVPSPPSPPPSPTPPAIVDPAPPARPSTASSPPEAPSVSGQLPAFPAPTDPSPGQREPNAASNGQPAEPSGPPKVPEAWHAAAALWGLQALPAQGRKPSAGPELRSKLGQRLLTAVRRDADAVMDAIRFASESQHARAQHLRAERYGLETVLRHVEDYAGLWREFGAQPIPSAAQRSRAPPSRPGDWSGGDGLIDRLFREVSGGNGSNGREVIDVDDA